MYMHLEINMAHLKAGPHPAYSFLGGYWDAEKKPNRFLEDLVRVPLSPLKMKATPALGRLSIFSVVLRSCPVSLYILKQMVSMIAGAPPSTAWPFFGLDPR